MNATAFCVLSVSVLAACGDPGAPESGAVSGGWEWVSSCCGFAGQSITPATEGYTLTYVFGSDRVEVFRNDSLLIETGYSIEFEAREEDGDPVGEIEYDEPVLDRSLETVRLGQDTLVLIDPFCDDCFGARSFARSE